MTILPSFLNAFPMAGFSGTTSTTSTISLLPLVKAQMDYLKKKTSWERRFSSKTWFPFWGGEGGKGGKGRKGGEGEEGEEGGKGERGEGGGVAEGDAVRAVLKAHLSMAALNWLGRATNYIARFFLDN